jgi:hypothetical protein
MRFFAKKAYQKPTIGFLARRFCVMLLPVMNIMPNPARLKTGLHQEKNIKK